MYDSPRRQPLTVRLPIALLWLLGLLGATCVYAVPNQPVLWHATSEQGEVYLFGSMHFGKPEMYPLPNEVESAFRAADNLAVEVDVGAVPQEEIMGLVARQGMYLDGSTLDSHVSRSTAESLNEAAARYGLPLEVLRLQRPWLAALTLAGMAIHQSGFSETQGVDRYFLELARGAKPIVELETFEDQLTLLSELPAADQEWMLSDMLGSLAETPEYFNQVYAAWSSGDDAKIDDMLNASLRSGSDEERLYDRLIVRRNHAMTSRIEELVGQGGTSFIVVGAGHLVGEVSIVELLRQRGYRIERL